MALYSFSFQLLGGAEYLILDMHPQHAKLDTFVFSTQINATRYLCVPGKLKNKMDYAYIFGYTKLKIGFS